MATDSIWQRAVDLTDRIFQVASGPDLPRGNQWLSVVTVFLTQANARLDSIRMLLDKNHWDSAVILTRSLFELAVNMAYIDQNVTTRLPEYLKHGGMVTTSEEAEKRRKEVAKGDHPAVKDFVPGQTWKPLSDMCKDLGSDWLGYYQTFYRFASVPTHAGSFTLGRSYLQLLEQQPPSDHDKATVIVTALAFHLSVAEVAAKTFPLQIDLERIEELRSECQVLGKSLT